MTTGTARELEARERKLYIIVRKDQPASVPGDMRRITCRAMSNLTIQE